MANILLIDDDMDFHEIVRAFLSPSDHKLRCAASGLAGLDLLNTGATDLIILDLAMPTMGGQETYTLIRANPSHASTPIVIMSVHADHNITPDMKADPHVSTVLKPIDFSQLTEAVNAALQKA